MKFLPAILGVALCAFNVSAQFPPILRNSWTTNTSTGAVSALTADGSPDGAADYLITLDASAGTLKKVLLNNLPGSGAGEANVGANLGIGYPFYATKTGVSLNFNTWTNDATLTVSSNANTFTIGRAALTGDVTTSGNAATIAANSVALGTDTSGFYALGDSEGGAATTVVTVDGSDTTSFVGIFDGATGNQAAKTDGALLYNAGTGLLTSTTFAGAGGGLTLNAAGFNGNLTTGDDTVQEVAQKLDDLSVGSGGVPITINGTNVTVLNVTNNTAIAWSLGGGSNVTATLVDASVTEAKLTLTDVTTANATTNAHGFLPKLNNDDTTFLNGKGQLTSPIGAGDMIKASSNLVTGSIIYQFSQAINSGTNIYVDPKTNYSTFTLTNHFGLIFTNWTSNTGVKTLLLRQDASGGWLPSFEAATRFVNSTNINHSTPPKWNTNAGVLQIVKAFRLDGTNYIEGPITLDSVILSQIAAGSGGGLALDASGFNGNLATSDNTFQEVAQKLDDLSVGGGSPTNVMTVINATDAIYGTSTNSANNTTNIQAALDAAANSLSFPTGTAGRRVFLPEGSYTITGTLNVPPYVTLEGASSQRGRGTEIVKITSGAAVRLKYPGGQLIKGITFSSNAKSSGAIGVQTDTTNSVTNFKLENLQFSNFNSGILLTNAWDAEIISVYSQNCSNGMTIGPEVNAIHVYGGQHDSNDNVVLIMGYRCHSLSFYGLTIENSTFGIRSTNGVGGGVQGLQIENCHFEGNTGYDIHLNGSGDVLYGVTISGNLFQAGGVTLTNIVLNDVYSPVIGPGNNFGSNIKAWVATGLTRRLHEFANFYSDTATITDSSASSTVEGPGSVPAFTTTGTLRAATLIGNYDSATSGSTLKQVKYVTFQRPDYGDGAGAVPQTNLFNVSGLMHYTLSGNAETNANWVVYEWAVPSDFDTNTVMTAKFNFLSGGTDADNYVFDLTYSQQAVGAAYVTGTTIATAPIRLTITPTTAANGDLQSSSATSLTAWAAIITPGVPIQIRLARLQNTQDDGARDVSLVLSHGTTQ